MQSALLAQKANTSQRFDEKLQRIPVTTLVTKGLSIVDIKTDLKDGYTALKLALGSSKNIDKPTLGQLKKAGITHIPQNVAEVRIKDNGQNRMEIVAVDEINTLKIGDVTLKIGENMSPSKIFQVGDFVDVTGISKGKGFQGGVKRHGFHGGPKTHGQSDRWRAPGSVGATTTPGRTFKGQRMAGRMGTDRVTVQRLRVIEILEDAVIVKGVVPGNPGTLLEVRLSK